MVMRTQTAPVPTVRLKHGQKETKCPYVIHLTRRLPPVNQNFATMNGSEHKNQIEN